MNALQLSMGGEKPSSVETVTLNGAQYTKQVYENKNLYFNANGQLSVIEIVKPVVENALSKALEAYKKAYEKAKQQELAEAPADQVAQESRQSPRN